MGREAVIIGARRRLRPVLMTAFVASFGFGGAEISGTAVGTTEREGNEKSGRCDR